ncbi:hypothetical protein FHP24_20465 [Aliirhizobium smilacinae]|uniref:Uncharacterized protein n=1 Tax=Aliirhizobium smilacinae TaxID=1395944 RepID=A0A5C4XF42_9HYPH|nr:hypothetical protein FHP24_20465 [Rhizobium smilacinae]
MHLLPQSFGFQATLSSSQGKPGRTRHSSSQPLFYYFKSLPHLLPRQAFSFLRKVESKLRPSSLF